MKLGISKRSAIGLLPALLLLLAGACGNGDAAPTATPSASARSLSTTPQPVPSASDATLERALMRVDDLGEGWLRQSIADNSLTVADQYYCGKKVASLHVDAVAVFVNPTKNRSFMFEAISRFTDGAAAQAALDELNAAHVGCVDWVSTNGVSRTAWHTESFERANLGDGSFVERATGQFGAVSGASTAVSVVIRRNDSVLSIAEVGTDDLVEAETMGIAQKALSRYDSAGN